MQARVKAGWIKEEDLAPPPPRKRPPPKPTRPGLRTVTEPRMLARCAMTTTRCRAAQDAPGTRAAVRGQPATVKPVAEMIRFVVAPDGSVVPDLKRRLPGRGIWVTATRAGARDAVAPRLSRASFKRESGSPPTWSR